MKIPEDERFGIETDLNAEQLPATPTQEGGDQSAGGEENLPQSA
jgi:hypothetical protein